MCHVIRELSRNESTFPRWIGGSVIAVVLCCFVARSAYSQEPPPTGAEKPAATAAAAKPQDAASQEDIPLIKQEPFDLITLNAANNNAQLKVVPLEDGARKSPFRVDPSKKYVVRLLEGAGEEYEISGGSIVKVELYEELLLREAERLVREGKLDEAFDYFYLLRANYPDMPGLAPAIHEYLYEDAVQLIREKRWSEALAVVEQLRRQAPQFQPERLKEFFDRLVDRVVNGYVEQKKYRAARTILERIEREYAGDAPASLAQWSSQLAQLAAERRDRARSLMAEGKFREAIAASKEMMDIWPRVEGGQELNLELEQQYPLVVVGVMQPAKTHDSRRLDNWSARRTGRLVKTHLVEFLGPGPEGGEYDFPHGLIEHSEDRRRLVFRLNRLADDQLALTGYRLADRLRELADPHSPDYIPPWASLVAGISVRDIFEVDVDLTRPHVLPEALLRVPVTADHGDETTADPLGQGPFEVTLLEDQEVRFATRGFQAGGRLAEVVERTFEDSNVALAALRRGDIDLIDRVFPADAARLREDATLDESIRIEPYALPTVHMLIPNTVKNPFLAHRDFRRALIFAIDRQRLLTDELLGGREVWGCRLISGPFPAGAGDSDPLGYAYDGNIRPRRYDPRLAKLLTLVAQKQVADMAQKRGEEAPELQPLVIGHPAHELARVACQAIAAYLKVIGLDCTLREFPPGICRDETGDCDLVYAEIAIWEPVVDARRLLGAGGPAASDSPYILQTLRWLELAENWGDVRERLLQIHGTVHNEAAIIPLWQMVDFYAYRQRVRNVGEDLVWLYQHVDQWRLSSVQGEEE